MIMGMGMGEEAEAEEEGGGREVYILKESKRIARDILAQIRSVEDMASDVASKKRGCRCMHPPRTDMMKKFADASFPRK